MRPFTYERAPDARAALAAVAEPAPSSSVAAPTCST